MRKHNVIAAGCCWKLAMVASGYEYTLALAMVASSCEYTLTLALGAKRELAHFSYAGGAASERLMHLLVVA